MLDNNEYKDNLLNRNKIKHILREKEEKRECSQKREILVEAATTIGGREENQDNLFINSIINLSIIEEENYWESIDEILEGEKRFYIVCDGMGGCDDGSIASQIAIEYFQNNIQTLKKQSTPIDIMKALININYQIADYYRIIKQRGGTTISIVQINSDSTMEVYNIGDSPVLLIRDGKLTWLSEEQSMAGIKRKNHLISEKEYHNSKEKNILLAYLGDEKIDSIQNLYYSDKIPYQKKDIILIASDGLTSGVSDKKIIKILEKGKGVKGLIEEAKKKKDSDNITIIKLMIK